MLARTGVMRELNRHVERVFNPPRKRTIWESGMTVHGTHRIKNPEGIEDGVRVTAAGMGFQVSETRYLAEGYAPPITTLPWGTSTPEGGKRS
jgi:hypothetical protein